MIPNLWSLWTFGEAAPDQRRVASVMLSQESPVCVRITVRPTEPTAGERGAIEALVKSLSPDIPDRGVLRASLDTVEGLLSLAPLFELRCLVASAEPLSPSLLAVLGGTVSQPGRHRALSEQGLQGGFAVIADSAGAGDSILRTPFERCITAGGPRTIAPAELARLRRLFGAWEAASMFRLPFAKGSFPGLESLVTPALDPPHAELPTSGRRVGTLVGHGSAPVYLESAERFRHLYVSGQTGTGKSTLLLNLALQDIASGAGVAVLDPHGDLVEAILEHIPDDRLDDVVLVDAADPVAVVGVNLLEAETPVQAEYVVSELCRMFYELFDPHRQGIVGPMFESMLRQAANLLLAHPEQPSSFLDISSIFADEAVRKHLVATVSDPILREYWVGEMSQRGGTHFTDTVAWFRSKFEIFRTSRLVRNIVGQAKSTISFSDVLNEQRILLVNLSKGLLGQYNSALLGYIVFTRLWSAALERASMPYEDRRDFFVYIDEFQNMTSDSLPDVLSEARKFRMGITLANQFFSQIPERTRDAIMGNVGNRITFRVGPQDAASFAGWLGREVRDEELTRLPNHVAVASVSDGGVPLDPFVVRTDRPRLKRERGRAELIRQRSRDQWARPVAELDPQFFDRWRHVEGSLSARQDRAAAAQPTAAPPPTPSPQASPMRGASAPVEPPTAKPSRQSFLDRWLANRREGSLVILVRGSTAGVKGKAVQVFQRWMEDITREHARRLVNEIPVGLDVSVSDRGVADGLVADLSALGLEVRVQHLPNGVPNVQS